MDDRRDRPEQDANEEDRAEERSTVPAVTTAMGGAIAPVAGLAAVLMPDLADDAPGTDDESEEARGARIEADPPTDPSAPAR